MFSISRCDVDIMYVPPRFRTAADLEQLHRPPPEQHTMFRGLHRHYVGCDVMVLTTPADLETGLHWLEVRMCTCRCLSYAVCKGSTNMPMALLHDTSVNR